MKLRRAYNICACLLVVLAVTSYFCATVYVGEPALLMGVFTLPAIIVAWWLSANGRLLLPRWMVNAMLLFAMAYAAMRALQGVKVEVVAELVAFIQLIKIGDRRAPRDDAQILALAVFLAIAAMLTSVQLFVGVQLVVFVPLLVATVMLFQLYSGWFGARAAAGMQPGSAMTTADIAAGSPGGARRLAWTAVIATCATMILGAAVFIIMPRGVGENAFGSFAKTVAGSQTGFTDRVTLGGRGVISSSSRIVLDLIVRESGGAFDLNSSPEAGQGANIGTPDSVHYLRGAVLDVYQPESGTWIANPSAQPRELMGAESDQIIQLGRLASTPVEQTVLFHSSPRQTPLFAEWRPGALLLVRETRPSLRTLEKYGIVTLMRSGGGPLQYTVWSGQPSGFSSEPTARTPVTFPSEAVRRLAVSILNQGGVDPDPVSRPIDDDPRAAKLIQDHLQSEFSYTLIEQGAAQGRDPIESFLFDTKQGHCEYFAAAMVALCRSVGINARMVAGYLAAEFDSSTGRYIVRESNAHAWVEAELGVDRWRRYDPTPPADLVRLHKPKLGLFGRLQRALESVEYAWNTSVVGFDESARQRLLGPSRGKRSGIFRAIDNAAGRLQYAGPRVFISAVVTGLAVFIAVAAAGLVLRAAWPGIRALTGLRFRRRVKRGATASRAAAAPMQVYSRLLESLRRRGHPKPEWRPPKSHVESIADQDPAIAASAADVVRVYYGAVYGAKLPDPAELAAAEAALIRIDSQGT